MHILTAVPRPYKLQQYKRAFTLILGNTFQIYIEMMDRQKERFDSQGKFTRPHSCRKLKFASTYTKLQEVIYINTQLTKEPALHVDCAQGEQEEHGVVCRECSVGCGGVSLVLRSVASSVSTSTLLKMSHLVNFQVSVGLFAL